MCLHLFHVPAFLESFIMSCVLFVNLCRWEMNLCKNHNGSKIPKSLEHTVCASPAGLFEHISVESAYWIRAAFEIQVILGEKLG